MAGLPSLPAGLQPGLKTFLVSLSEQMGLTVGDRGSPLAARPTYQDLVDIGVITVNASQAQKAQGKSIALGVDQFVQSAFPNYFTDLLQPPAPVGLIVTMNTSNIVLGWTPWVSTYYLQTLVYRSTVNDLTTAVNIGSTTGATYVDNLPPPGSVYYYWIRHQARNGNLSDFNLLSGTTIGNVASAPTISFSFNLTDLVLTWPTPTSTLLIQFYVIKYGADYQGGTLIGTANVNTLRLTVDFVGSRTFWIAPVDVNGQVGLAGSVNVVVAPPDAPIVAQSVQNDALVLTYTSAKGSLPVASYEVRFGASWAAGTTVQASAGTRFETAVNWTGSRIFWVAGYDTAGNVGVATQVTFNPPLPSAPVVSATIIDNNVLLSWTNSVGGLTVDHYVIDRNGTPFGTVAGNFTVVFESVSANYTYGVSAVDTAGNTGVRGTVTVTVAQPPDFVLFSNADSSFTGTLTNAYKDVDGSLIVADDTTETWATHFTNRSWTSIADQIAAGYTFYPVGRLSGQYVETIDYGATVASTRITMTVTSLQLAGSTTITPTIETSPNGSTWTSLGNVYTAVGTSFRYVRYTLAFSATHAGSGGASDTTALLQITKLNFRLDAKQKTTRGMVSAVSTDVGGTVVDITGQFIDVTAIDVSALGTTPLYVVYDFVDAPNPTQFKVLVFNSSGTRVSATVSYTVSGV
jgi:hypothetical protein